MNPVTATEDRPDTIPIPLTWGLSAEEVRMEMEMSGEMYLKIKIRSLAAEARIIRHHERVLRDRNRRRWSPRRDELRVQLNRHRVADVRHEQRATLLAYGFIRDRALNRIEALPAKVPGFIWERVYTMLRKYHIRDDRLVRQRVARWRDEAREAAAS